MTDQIPAREVAQLRQALESARRDFDAVVAEKHALADRLAVAEAALKSIALGMNGRRLTPGHPDASLCDWQIAARALSGGKGER